MARPRSLKVWQKPASSGPGTAPGIETIKAAQQALMHMGSCLYEVIHFGLLLDTLVGFRAATGLFADGPC